MKYSIIIPVYNVEKYLREAVGSILAQSYSDYEIILVDDGSPDKCPELCDFLAESNEKIKVIHKQNGGLSDARNVGTAKATGDYIIYLDSDDRWIDNDALRSISAIIDKDTPDVVIFGVSDYDPVTGKSVISRGNYNQELLNTMNPEQLTDSLISSNNFPGAAWMLVTKRAFLDQNNIGFVKGVTAEDFDWIVKVFSKAKTIKVINRIVYQYRYNSEGSITSKPRLSGIVGIHNALSNWLEYKGVKYPSISNYLCGIYLQALLNYAGLDNDDQKQAIKLLRDDKAILNSSNKLKYRILNVLLSICGIGFISKLIKQARETLKKK